MPNRLSRGSQTARKSETARLIASLGSGERSKVLLHRQLFERLKQAILSGQIKPGSRLPSSRALAAELNIARNTILLAYELLELEGLTGAHVGRGTTVSLSATLRREAPNTTPMQMERLGAEPSNAEDPFRVGAPAYDSFPFRTWNTVVSRCTRIQTAADLAYQNPLGHTGLRRLLAAHLLTRRGLKCDPDRIFIVPGYQGGLSLAVHALLHAGSRVWVEDPGHGPTREALSRLGMTAVAIPADPYGLNVTVAMQMAPDADMAIVTPVHQFPLGVALSADRRAQLLAWAESSGRWIIEDDYDTEFHFTGRPPDALAAASSGGRVIYIGTFSKVLYPSLRLGYVVVPPALVDSFAETRRALDHHQPHLIQDIVRCFVEEGHFDRHLGRMRSLYRERQLALADAISLTSEGRVRPLSTSGGTHLTTQFDGDVDDVAFADGAAQLGVRLSPLSCFATNLAKPTGLVLGFSSSSPAVINSAMNRLAKLFAAPFPRRPT